LHVVRHTSTTLALPEGVPVHIVVAKWATTRRRSSTYVHLLPQSDVQAAERGAAALAL
jgi:hypothetical protein